MGDDYCPEQIGGRGVVRKYSRAEEWSIAQRVCGGVSLKESRDCPTDQTNTRYDNRYVQRARLMDQISSTKS
jgi:hypothetical protein